MVVLFSGNATKCCSIRQWKLPEIKTGIFIEWKAPPVTLKWKSNGPCFVWDKQEDNWCWWLAWQKWLTTGLWYVARQYGIPWWPQDDVRVFGVLLLFSDWITRVLWTFMRPCPNSTLLHSPAHRMKGWMFSPLQGGSFSIKASLVSFVAINLDCHTTLMPALGDKHRKECEGDSCKPKWLSRFCTAI